MSGIRSGAPVPPARTPLPSKRLTNPSRSSEASACLTGVRLALENRFELAVIMVLVAAFLDGIDGRVARMIKGSSKFGAQMDSLADIVNFGVAPALVLYAFMLDQARTFGWSMLLGRTGLINGALQTLGLPVAQILYTETAIVIGLVHIMLPFMVIPVWTVLQKLDPAVEAAALTLGASRLTALRRVVFPQAMLGILSGSLIVFALSASSFVIPGLLGGRRLKMAATIVYDEFLTELNWPLGAAIAIIVLVANLAIMIAYSRLLEGQAKKKLG